MLLIITVIILFTYTVILLMFFMGWCALLPKIAHPRPEVVPFSVVKSPRRNSVFIGFESITSASIQSLDYVHYKLSLSSSSIASKQQKGRSSQQRHSSPSNGAASEAELGRRLDDSDAFATGPADKKSRSASIGDSGVSRSLSSAQASGGSGEPLDGSASGSLLAAIPKSASGQNDYLHPKYSLPPIKINITDHLLADRHLLRTPVQLKCSPMKTHSRSFDDRDETSSFATDLPSSTTVSVWQQHMPLANLRRLTVASTMAGRRQSHYRDEPSVKSSSTFLLSGESFQRDEPYRQCLLPVASPVSGDAGHGGPSPSAVDNEIFIV